MLSQTKEILFIDPQLFLVPAWVNNKINYKILEVSLLCHPYIVSRCKKHGEISPLFSIILKYLWLMKK